MKNIVTFKVDKKIDFQNHLIGMRVYKKRHNPNPKLVEYYKKLEKASDKQRFEIFKIQTARYYNPKRKKFRDLILKQTQEAWNLVEKDYIKAIERVHGIRFSYKEITGILSTAERFGYNLKGSKKWFACSSKSPLLSIDIAMHEIMHFVFHKHFHEKWQEKYSLTNEQLWAIKEALTVILNLECNDLMFGLDQGYPEHEKIRMKIKKDWNKYKNFEKVLDNLCEHVKKKKLFL